MAQKKYKSTITLDKTTAQRLERLSLDWNVSESVVVRRLVELAESSLRLKETNPPDVLKYLHENRSGLDRDKVEAHLEDIRRDRREWRNQEASL
ncbi:MAG: hypothetical protein JJU05_11480 [Verrucomicrobia bacterium]|nr:hypothetical protein [Verrucomicrobiota bacterium]MCH8528798.1 hypothetical protein [Kiritimatiellia bacterium]